MTKAPASNDRHKDTREWWGLSRLVPRFWMPRPLRIAEVFYAGSVLGLSLLIIAWAFLRFDADQLKQLYPQWMEPWTLARVLWCIFASPCVVTLLLWLGGSMEPSDPTRLTQTDTQRFLERVVFLFREQHHLRKLDQIAATLLVSVGAYIAWQVFKVGLPFIDWLPEAHVAAAALTVVLLSATLRKNRFHPRARTFEVPGWFTDLTRQLRQNLAQPLTTSASVRDPGFEIVWPDDLPTFAYHFSDDLPGPIQGIGVHVGPEVTRLMTGLLELSGGSYFRQRNCEAAGDMINPFEGPLGTIGLLEYQRLVAQIMTRARVGKWDGRKLASVILSFVQREITYVRDEASTGYPEYGRFPLQTLTDRQGDCECKAILCCALLAYCGLDCALIIEDSHVLCGLRRPRGWLSWFNTWFTKRHAADYLFGESTDGNGGGQWLPPTSGQLSRVQNIVPIRAIDLSSDA